MEITAAMIIGLGLGFAMGHYWGKSKPQRIRPRIGLSVFVQQEHLCPYCQEPDPAEMYLWTYIGDEQGAQRLRHAVMALALSRFSSMSRGLANIISMQAASMAPSEQKQGQA